jgi:hypothetical protein
MLAAAAVIEEDVAERNVARSTAAETRPIKAARIATPRQTRNILEFIEN